MARMTSLRNGWLVEQRGSGKDRGSLHGGWRGGGGETYDASREEERRQTEMERIETSAE